MSRWPIYLLAVSHFGFPKIILYIYCSPTSVIIYDSRELYTMTTSGGPSYDLNPVESFCSLFKYLWLPPDQLEKSNGARYLHNYCLFICLLVIVFIILIMIIILYILLVGKVTYIQLFRAKLAIVDTLIFQDGTPFMWLFTSDKTGVIAVLNTFILQCYST